MLECETWYEFAGRRHNEQHFMIPREEIAALRHAVTTVRRRNSAFHIRLKRPVEGEGRRLAEVGREHTTTVYPTPVSLAS